MVGPRDHVGLARYRCTSKTPSKAIAFVWTNVRIVRNERPRTLGVSTFNGGRVCFIAYRRNFLGYETQIHENPLLYDENVISVNAPTSKISLLNARTRTSSINNYSLSLDSNTIYNRRRRQPCSPRMRPLRFVAAPCIPAVSQEKLSSPVQDDSRFHTRCFCKHAHRLITYTPSSWPTLYKGGGRRGGGGGGVAPVQTSHGAAVLSTIRVAVAATAAATHSGVRHRHHTCIHNIIYIYIL